MGFGVVVLPEFFDLFVRELLDKSERISREYYARYSSAVELIRDAFRDFWVTYALRSAGLPNIPILAVDSSMYYVLMGNGGFFYVVRALALGHPDVEYRKLVTDFDYTSDPNYRAHTIIQRKMEWLEHLVALEAVESGFRGVILIDGSLYGRIVHIPLETGFIHDRDFMLRYFEDLYRFLQVCERNNVLVIGISKESRTSYLRTYLVRRIIMEKAGELGLDMGDVMDIFRLARENKKKVFKEIKNRGLEGSIIEELFREYISRRPDFQMIINFANTTGYTKPLILGMPSRWERYHRIMRNNPKGFLRSYFPISSRREGFMDWGLKVIRKIMELPAIISFHILLNRADTPMRIDLPAWALGINKKAREAIWAEEAKVNLSRILDIISAGYCGLENYNIWLKAVDERVKIHRDIFDNLYLPKFEEVIGRLATARGYRRVRFP